MRLITLYIDDHHEHSLNQLKTLMLNDWPIIGIHDTSVPGDHVLRSNHVADGCSFCVDSSRELQVIQSRKGQHHVSERTETSIGA